MDKTKTRDTRLPPGMRIYLVFMSVLSRVLPHYAAERAYYLWFRSPRYIEPAREVKWRVSAKIDYLQTNTHKIATYHWLPTTATSTTNPASAPIVVLMHGWSGRATQMGAFVQPLLDAGFQVVGFDAPGHGLSSGNETNFFEVEEALTKVCNSIGHVTGVIAHSFGSMVLAYALRHSIQSDRVVLISSPNDMVFLMQRFCRSLGFIEKTTKLFQRKFEQRFNDDIWNMLAADINASYLDIPALIIHDKDDGDVPVNLSRRLAAAWENSNLMITEGLGHTRILRNKAVIQSAVTFLSE